jgi:hypothetical protein
MGVEYLPVHLCLHLQPTCPVLASLSTEQIQPYLLQLLPSQPLSEPVQLSSHAPSLASAI